MTALARRPLLLLIVCVALTVLIFVVDLNMPVGVADGIPYVAVVLLALWFRDPRYPVYFAVAGSVLTWIGYFGSPPGGEVWHALTNRGLTTFAIVTTAVLSLQKRRTERALRASEARAQVILDTTTDAIVTFDLRGYVTSVNPAAERTFGLAGRDVSELQAEALIAPAHAARFRSLLDQEAGASPGRAAVEVVAQRQDGTTFSAELSVVRVTLGEDAMFTMTVRDITERRRLEQEILNLTERERTRIGHDLNEGLGQMLTGIGLINRSLSSRLKAAEQPYAEEVAQVTELIREADQYARGLVRGLIPVDLDAAGLGFALRRLAEESRKRWGIACTFREEGEVLIHDNMVATHLYRIAQEAIHDAAQRKAGFVSVTLAAGPVQARLRVEDDGQAAGPEPDGFGRAIMTYRAHLIGASFDVDQAPDGGTVLSCTLPYPSAANGRV